MEARARLLLVHFLRAGISSFEELKARLDGHCKDLLGASLSSDAIADFLESNGLWEDARLVRGKKASAKSRGGGVGAGTNTSSVATDTSGPHKLRGLAQVLRNVLVASSVEEAAAAYMARTADEEALQQLGEHAAQVVPALVSLRSASIERELFEALDVHREESTENAGNAEKTVDLDEAMAVDGSEEIGTTAAEPPTNEPGKEPEPARTVETTSLAAATEPCSIPGETLVASVADEEQVQQVVDAADGGNPAPLVEEALIMAGRTEALATAVIEREMHETAAVEESFQQAEVVGIPMHAGPKRGLSDVASNSTRRVRLRCKTKQPREFS